MCWHQKNIVRPFGLKSRTVTAPGICREQRRFENILNNRGRKRYDKDIVHVLEKKPWWRLQSRCTSEKVRCFDIRRTGGGGLTGCCFMRLIIRIFDDSLIRCGDVLVLVLVVFLYDDFALKPADTCPILRMYATALSVCLSSVSSPLQRRCRHVHKQL